MSVLPLLSGGGGLDLRTFDFTLSVRARRCTVVASGKTSTRRGIVDTKEIPVPNGIRQHLLGIDNLQSHRQTRAVYAAIHLLLDCLEAHPGRAPRLGLAQPVEDLHRSVTGANVSHRFQLADGRQMTGVQLLFTYCDWVRACQQDTALPEWAEAELDHITDFLTKLNDRGLTGLEGLCDHATLWMLWKHTLAEHGITLESADAARQALIGMGDAPVVWRMISAKEPDADPPAWEKLLSAVRWKRRGFEVLERYVLAMRKFMIIAYEYGDIMHEGFFCQLLESGLTAPGMLFTKRLLDAQCNQSPPEEEGRCNARANAILSIAQSGERALANWDEVRSQKRGLLDLSAKRPSDAFEWGPIPPPLTKNDEMDSFQTLRAYLVEHNTFERVRRREHPARDRERQIP